MSLKRVKPKPKQRIKRGDKRLRALLRMAKIVTRMSSAVHPKNRRKAKEAALKFHDVYYDHLFLRIRQCIDKAEKTGSWDFMRGCFSQATEIYAVAAIAYEKYDTPLMPDHMFDDLAKFLLVNYEHMTAANKKRWNLNKGIFRAGTGSHFHDVSKFPELVAYDARLLTYYKEKANKRERLRAKDRPGLLRKKPFRRKPR